jgi:hypothetical protein
MRLAGYLFIEHHLRNPRPVAHVKEDEIAMIAPPVHPAHQDNVLTIVLDAELATLVCSLQTT